MDTGKFSHFIAISKELCNLLYVKDYDKAKANALVDNLNAQPIKTEHFIRISDASTLVTALCLNIQPADESLSAKTSHLVNNVVTKLSLPFSDDFLHKVIFWHMQCLKKCSDMILPDILHNLQSILQYSPRAACKFTDNLIGNQGILINIIDMDRCSSVSSTNPLQITLIALKCICTLTIVSDEKSADETTIPEELKENVANVVISLLLKGANKTHDETLYCKVAIAALRVMSQLYFNNSQATKVPLPEVMGICKHYILYGLVNQGSKPERIMPAHQVIAPTPVNNAKGGKKQKLRKQRNNAIESLKKDIPVSDRNLLKNMDNIDSSSSYKPASQSYLETQKNRTSIWPLTSDSDMSDVENAREAKLVALKARVRQSASNLLLVLVKVTEKKDMFGYWWSLLPDSPDAQNWLNDEAAKKTLPYCAVFDPVASSRASALGVILALLAGSRVYLSQAESSKKTNASFTPFSESLGYIVICMHKVLTGILDSERIQSVILVALKCCAALLQATPYHKMKEGLISELVISARKFLVHRDVSLQVAALVTMGCVLSVDPKIDEILRSVEKDAHTIKKYSNTHIGKQNDSANEECEDFEEGYSDDEMFTAVEEDANAKNDVRDEHYFKSWILDICFKNLGWLFRGNEVVKWKPSAIPVMLESLQVLSAIGFHQFSALLRPHLTLLADVLSEMLHCEHQDVVLQAARTVSVIGDAIQKTEQTEEPANLGHCVYMWEKLLTPLSNVIQFSNSPPAKAIVCDCIANIGEKSFKELSRRLQVLCCALLVGSCSDEEATVRAAAVRALAMAVMFRTMREDICFVSDCGENVLRALNEPVLVVRAKAAWALGNLSDALVLNLDDPDIDDIDDDLLLRLLQVSVQCATDNDKVKMSATRGLGNLLRIIKGVTLHRKPQLKSLCETAIEKLLDCACKVTNMKVRWNACYAIGNAMKNDHLFTCFSFWQRQVFPNLCALSQDCKNLKVRINAAVALRSPRMRTQYGGQFVLVWRGIMAAIENAANVDDYTEYRHKDNLIEQLCVTLAHLCCLLNQADLHEILDPLIFHHDSAKGLFVHLCHKLPPENASCLRILEAAKYVTMELTAASDTQQQALAMLQDIFIWDM